MIPRRHHIITRAYAQQVLQLLECSFLSTCVGSSGRVRHGYSHFMDIKVQIRVFQWHVVPSYRSGV